MKQPLLIIVFAVASVTTAFGQSTTPYQVDNFDFAGAVKVDLPVPVTSSRKLMRLRKQTASVDNDYLQPINLVDQLPSTNIGGALDGFTTGDANVDAFIVDSGKRNSVDPMLLYAIMHQESTFRRNAVSPKGARGLMQLMPGTAMRFGVRNVLDPRQNIEGGARYMRFLLDQFDDDVPLALAGYNAGEGAVMKYGNNIPPYAETQEYVRRITKRYALIRDPLAAQTANSLTRRQLATVQQKASAPLNIYEPSVFAVRLADGRLQLLSQ